MRKCKSLSQNNYVFWSIAVVLSVAANVSVWVFHWPIDPGTIPSHHLPPGASVPHIKNLPPMTNDQLYQSIIDVPLSMWISVIGPILFLCIGINASICNRLVNFPAWFSADLAQLQIAALWLGLPGQVYFAVWWHALTALHNPWGSCVVYCLAILTIYGAYVNIAFFLWRLPMKVYRLMIVSYCMTRLAYLNLTGNR